MLVRIDEMHRSNAFKILQWLAFSARPLKILELAEMLAVDLSDGPRYKPDLKLLEPSDLMTMCSTLITTVGSSKSHSVEMPKAYDQYDTRNDPRNQDSEVVELVHLSVADYLLSDRIKHGDASFFSLSGITGNLSIAQTCLVYLLHPATGRCRWDVHKGRVEVWPLYNYAVQFWPFHIRAAGENLDEQTWNILQRFFATKSNPLGGAYGAWQKALAPDISPARAGRTQPLYYAASFGMTAVVRKLLEQVPNIDVDALGGRRGSSALQVACYRNYPAVVKLLLDAHADPLLRNDVGETCLYWAKRQKHHEIQTLLEEHGAKFAQENTSKTLDGIAQG